MKHPSHHNIEVLRNTRVASGLESHAKDLSGGGCRGYPLRIKNRTKNTRNENGIISSFRRIFWHPPSLLREQSLMRGQLSSLPYLTWLSLPFQCFSFMVVFATYSCSFDTGIYTLSSCQNLNDLNGYFNGPGQKTHRGLLQMAEPAGFEHCLRDCWHAGQYGRGNRPFS